MTGQYSLTLTQVNGMGINPTGVFIWKLLDGLHTTIDIQLKYLKSYKQSAIMYPKRRKMISMTSFGTYPNRGWSVLKLKGDDVL